MSWTEDYCDLDTEDETYHYPSDEAEVWYIVNGVLVMTVGTQVPCVNTTTDVYLSSYTAIEPPAIEPKTKAFDAPKRGKKGKCCKDWE